MPLYCTADKNRDYPLVILVIFLLDSKHFVVFNFFLIVPSICVFFPAVIKVYVVYPVSIFLFFSLVTTKSL